MYSFTSFHQACGCKVTDLLQEQHEELVCTSGIQSSSMLTVCHPLTPPHHNFQLAPDEFTNNVISMISPFVGL